LSTSVAIAQIIKDKSGYELQEPVQFKEVISRSGLPSQYFKGFIKVDPNLVNEVAKKIKYFSFPDSDGNVWQCRVLPYDRELLGASRNQTNIKYTVFIKGIPKEYTHEQLDKAMS